MHYYGECISRYGPILVPHVSVLSLVFRDTSCPEVWEMRGLAHRQHPTKKAGAGNDKGASSGALH